MGLGLFRFVARFIWAEVAKSVAAILDIPPVGALDTFKEGGRRRGIARGILELPCRRQEWSLPATPIELAVVVSL